MYCCLKEKKTYKTSSIPIVNTDGQKKTKNIFWSTRAVEKNWYFYAFRNLVRKENYESPPKFQHNMY